MSQMFPPDMQQALMGGGGGPGAPAGPMPPDIAALLGGAGGPPQEGAPLPSDGAPGGGQDPLEEAIALLDEAIAAEADQEDQQVMRQCSAKLQQILAKNQAEEDSMLQGKSSPAGIRKSMAGAPAEAGAY
ncbi:MAG: hypothetical protein OEW47_12880 [Thermoleophilia bacterium]|nr:hypothetical protein [Thermoleophilia bacterium]